MNMREKIAKILDKARSTDSEAEAEMLMAKAQELMEEHQISALDLHDASDPMGMSKYGRFQAGPPSYKYEVARALAVLYGCKTVRMHDPLVWDKEKNDYKAQTWRLEMVGAESARITTELMTEFVWDQLTALSRKQSKELGVPASSQLRRLSNAMQSRIWGMVNAMQRAERMEARKATPAGKNALVLLDATKAEFDRIYANAGLVSGGKSKVRTSNGAAREGAAGIGLNRQTGGSSTLKLGR